MNDRAVIGGNNPPNPLEDATAPFQDAIEEAGNWLDGDPITEESQMVAIDAIIKELKPSKKKLDSRRLAATKPARDEVDKINKLWNTVSDDIALIIKKLVALAEPVRTRIADEKAAEKRAAYEEAERKRKEAEAKIEAAKESTDIDTAREAEAAMVDAKRG